MRDLDGAPCMVLATTSVNIIPLSGRSCGTDSTRPMKRSRRFGRRYKQATLTDTLIWWRSLETIACSLSARSMGPISLQVQDGITVLRHSHNASPWESLLDARRHGSGGDSLVHQGL